MATRRIIFITGATSGFGKATAEKFAANGYDLILNGRREDRLDELCRQLEQKFNIASITLPFDVRDEKAVLDSINGLLMTGRISIYF
jgi:NADP-dependent 3-hydroxy acid dehydrogenase YdfG